jgi:hypothetical protein
MKILLFTANGDSPPAFPRRPGLEFEHIRFETNNLEDLLLIAKYRVINYPTSLIIDDRGKVLLKVKGSIPGNYVDNFLR